MRDLLNKLLTGSMVVGAALVVSACGGSESTNTVDNTTVSGADAMAPVDGSTNDMTAVDGAAGAGGAGNMSADANMTMGTNSMSGGNMSSGNMSSGNMSSGNMMSNTATGNTTNAM